MKKLLASLALGLGLMLGGTAAMAQTAAAPAAAPAAEAKAEAPAEAAPILCSEKCNKGDTAWMTVATVLVILMTIPGLALFYGGLVRSKNMLSVLMQVFVVSSLIYVLWVLYGYSLTFTAGNPFIGGMDKLFFKGITFSYMPIAHMVWYWDGPDAITDAATLETVTAAAGWLWAKGALDFAGGTVVHINAAMAGLVGAFVIGKRLGYGKEAMTPHSLTLTMVGASLLWVGWFGFNAGSNLEANGVTALAFVNTLVATAAATLSWITGEALAKGKASMLGAASGAVAGLVAITPACGYVGPMGAIVIGVVAGFLCLWGVNGLKRMLGADDSLDVFGVHGVGGIVGALLTGVFAAPSLGGVGLFDYVANAANPEYVIMDQVWIQFQAVITTIVWSGVVSYIAYKLVDLVIGLRVTEEEEREGLDISSHGETAYHS